MTYTGMSCHFHPEPKATDSREEIKKSHLLTPP
nr:MAG TPA: hypothetical protein [Caudoviricetes sp.]